MYVCLRIKFSQNTFFIYEATKPMFIGMVSDTKIIVSWVMSPR